MFKNYFVCVCVCARIFMLCVFTFSYVYKLFKEDRNGAKFIANPWRWLVRQYFRLNVIARNPTICYSGEYNTRYLFVTKRRVGGKVIPRVYPVIITKDARG